MIKKPRKVPLIVPITLAIVPIALVVTAIIMSSKSIQEFRTYKEDFADSINYAMENDTLTAQYNGVTTLITDRNAEFLYDEVVAGDISEYLDEAPDGEYVLLEFGNGDYMKIWELDEESIIVNYTKKDNDSVLYSTFEISRFVNIERLISEEWDNSLVEE